MLCHQETLLLTLLFEKNDDNAQYLLNGIAFGFMLIDTKLNSVTLLSVTIRKAR